MGKLQPHQIKSWQEGSSPFNLATGCQRPTTKAPRGVAMHGAWQIRKDTKLAYGQKTWPSARQQQQLSLVFRCRAVLLINYDDVAAESRTDLACHTPKTRHTTTHNKQQTTSNTQHTTNQAKHEQFLYNFVLYKVLLNQ